MNIVKFVHLSEHGACVQICKARVTTLMHVPSSMDGVEKHPRGVHGHKNKFLFMAAVVQWRQHLKRFVSVGLGLRDVRK